MNVFFVRGVRHIEQEMQVFANSPQEAAKHFRESFPDFRVDIVTDGHDEEWEAFSRCEGCSTELFIGDNYYTDTDGIEFCETCYEKAKSATEDVE